VSIKDWFKPIADPQQPNRAVGSKLSRFARASKDAEESQVELTIEEGTHYNPYAKGQRAAHGVHCRLTESCGDVSFWVRETGVLGGRVSLKPDTAVRVARWILEVALGEEPPHGEARLRELEETVRSLEVRLGQADDAIRSYAEGQDEAMNEYRRAALSGNNS
jgi:hypothetical protein